MCGRQLGAAPTSVGGADGMCAWWAGWRPCARGVRSERRCHCRPDRVGRVVHLQVLHSQRAAATAAPSCEQSVVGTCVARPEWSFCPVCGVAAICEYGAWQAEAPPPLPPCPCGLGGCPVVCCMFVAPPPLLPHPLGGGCTVWCGWARKVPCMWRGALAPAPVPLCSCERGGCLLYVALSWRTAAYRHPASRGGSAKVVRILWR